MPLSPEATAFLDKLNHPLRTEIERLRETILDAGADLSENIKWNGPNYTSGEDDRITMRIHPPVKIQLILHRGAKKLAPLPSRLIADDSGLLDWKENDRAVITFKSAAEIENARPALMRIVAAWITAAK
ncbi:MAG: DUF1801 domain-containing protein [Bacteroidia bacterium]